MLVTDETIKIYFSTTTRQIRGKEQIKSFLSQYENGIDENIKIKISKADFDYCLCLNKSMIIGYEHFENISEDDHDFNN